MAITLVHQPTGIGGLAAYAAGRGRAEERERARRTALALRLYGQQRPFGRGRRQPLLGGGQPPQEDARLRNRRERRADIVEGRYRRAAKRMGGESLPEDAATDAAAGLSMGGISGAAGGFGAGIATGAATSALLRGSRSKWWEDAPSAADDAAADAAAGFAASGISGVPGTFGHGLPGVSPAAAAMAAAAETPEVGIDSPRPSLFSSDYFDSTDHEAEELQMKFWQDEFVRQQREIDKLRSGGKYSDDFGNALSQYNQDISRIEEDKNFAAGSADHYEAMARAQRKLLGVESRVEEPTPAEQAASQGLYYKDGDVWTGEGRPPKGEGWQYFNPVFGGFVADPAQEAEQEQQEQQKKEQDKYWSDRKSEANKLMNESDSITGQSKYSSFGEALDAAIANHNEQQKAIAERQEQMRQQEEEADAEIAKRRNPQGANGEGGSDFRFYENPGVQPAEVGTAAPSVQQTSGERRPSGGFEDGDFRREDVEKAMSEMTIEEAWDHTFDIQRRYPGVSDVDDLPKKEVFMATVATLKLQEDSDESLKRKPPGVDATPSSGESPEPPVDSTPPTAEGGGGGVAAPSGDRPAPPVAAPPPAEGRGGEGSTSTASDPVITKLREQYGGQGEISAAVDRLEEFRSIENPTDDDLRALAKVVAFLRSKGIDLSNKPKPDEYMAPAMKEWSMGAAGSM